MTCSPICYRTESGDSAMTGNNHSKHAEEVTLRSYAKINLSLEVIERRPDGYHNIRSLMQGIDLYDVIKITKCPQNGTKYNLPHCTIDDVVVYLCTDAKTIPTDMSNLALKGIKAVLDRIQSPDITELEVSIDKRLPVAAGIAGGSGNAAACMLGLNRLMGEPLCLRELMDIGALVGADVPFSLMMNARSNGMDAPEDGASRAAWVSGIGEIVEPTEPVPRFVVMANPGVSVSTKAAYEAIDAVNAARSDAEKKAAELSENLFVNDFERYTLGEYPEAARLRSVMEKELDADTVLMSGSGPTMVAYYRDHDRAAAGFGRMKEIADRETNWRAWFTSTGMEEPDGR